MKGFKARYAHGIAVVLFLASLEYIHIRLYPLYTDESHHHNEDMSSSLISFIWVEVIIITDISFELLKIGSLKMEMLEIEDFKLKNSISEIETPKTETPKTETLKIDIFKIEI